MVTSSFPRHAGDTSGVFLLPLVRMLSREGVDVRVVAPWDPEVDTGWAHAHRVTWVRYAQDAGNTPLFHGEGALFRARALGWRAWPLAASSVVELCRAALDARADVVLAHWLAPSGAAGALARLLGGPPLVTMVHGSDVRVLGGSPLARGVASASASMVAPSSSLAADASARLRVKAHVLPLPVDVVPLPAGFTLHDVGFMGRLIPQKGVDVLLRAAAAAGASVLVGGDGPERPSLEALARRLGARVTFAGTVLPEARGSFLSSVRVLAVPSVADEGRPAVMLEAARCGVPVVGSAVPGVGDVLPAQLVAPAGDATTLSRVLRGVLDGHHDRAAAAWCARVASQHDAARLAPAWSGLLEQAASTAINPSR